MANKSSTNAARGWRVLGCCWRVAAVLLLPLLLLPIILANDTQVLNIVVKHFPTIICQIPAARTPRSSPTSLLPNAARLDKPTGITAALCTCGKKLTTDSDELTERTERKRHSTIAACSQAAAMGKADSQSKDKP